MFLRYLLATIPVLWIDGTLLFHNTLSKFYWFTVTLAGIMWIFCYGIVEKAYKRDATLTFAKYPLTNIGIIITFISFPIALIQIIFAIVL